MMIAPLGAVDRPESVDDLPAPVDARRGLLRVLSRPHRAEDVVAAIHADPALLIRALRQANALPGRAHTIGSAAQAVEALGDVAVLALAERTPVYDPLKPGGGWGLLPQRFRAHAVAVRVVAERLAADLQLERADELATAAALHDVGRLALERAEPRYAALVPADATPEERVEAERAAFSLDHAELGGWIAREWRLLEAIAGAIESHHRDRLGLASLVRIADMLAHVRAGRSIDAGRLSTSVAVAGVAPSTLRAVVMELPDVKAAVVTPAPNPLSERERQVLTLLSQGLVAKQIALELSLAENTVRSHLHRIYRRIGVADRTQAVLMARDRGWL